MERTAYGNLQGYTNHEVKEVGEDIELTSIHFYEKLADLTTGKDVVYRVSPRASKDEGRYRFYARVHVKD